MSGTMVGGLGMSGTGRYFLGFTDKGVEDNITYEFTGYLKYDVQANQPPSMVEFNIVLDTPIVFENPSMTGYFNEPSLSDSWYPAFQFYVTKFTTVIE